MSFGAHGVYAARDTQDPASSHIIAFAPTRVPVDLQGQGEALRHETERFVYQIRHPNHVRNRYILVAGAAALGGCMGALVGVNAGTEMSHSLALAAEIPIDSVSIFGGTILGSATAFVPALMGHIAFGPSEIQAEWAQYRRRFELPDGVLQIEFA